ncbi:MAG TPA: DUF177 domain-containing protein [Acidimicrobiia bacterium]|nr:DUF177 domain-containing protein [Acidimicrobiia bacterium]
MSGLRIDVADLLSHPGARRDVVVDEELADLGGAAARVVGPVELRVGLERIPEGIVVRGTVGARWRAECSVCLRELDREIVLHADELFEPDPVEGETYPILGHEIDLEQLVRDTVLLELPLAPHCDEPCEPAVTLDEADEPVDPRWAVLSELEL